MSVNHRVRSAVARALAVSAVAAFGLTSFTANAQQAATSPTGPTASASKKSQQLQTVIVTGSLISRTSIETPSPVQILSAAQMVQSGYTDFSSILKNISANGASTLSQSFSFAFAAGASGVSLRGLTVGDTLVLIDGERSVPYPLLDDNQRSFVDLASIPFTAIQSVQIDKNGASGVYGSDAIAGVVNVILRKEYQGFKVTAETGTSERGDGTMEHVGFIGGHGSLAEDGYNWYISGDFRHQDQILARNRHGLWDQLDMTPFGGTYGGFSNLGVGSSFNPFFPFPNSTTGYFIDPATGNVVSYLPGCSALAQSMNKCTAIYPGSQLQPATSRADLLGKFTKELGDNWTLSIQASWFNSSSEEVSGYSGGSGNIAGITNLVFGPGVPFSVVPPTALTTPNIITVPSTNPMYPNTMCPAAAGGGYQAGAPSWCGQPLAFQYNFPELGPTSVQTNTNTYRLLASLDGRVAGWKVHATAGAMYAKMSYKLTSQINWQDLQSALNNGYVFGSSGASQLFAPTMESTPWSELDLVDIHGQHKLFNLPGGPLQLAVGVQWYRKVQDEHAPPAAVSGLQSEGGGPIYVIGTEKDAAAFLELDGKPLKHFEVDAAGRLDHYQGIGSAFTPQVGVKYSPWHWIALRGTWGKGFRAPSAAEGGASGELFGAGSYTDPVLCPNAAPSGAAAGPGDFPSQCGFGVTGFQTANTHLQNVKSTNWTVGLVLQPLRNLSLTADYYNIKVTNDIISAFEAGGFSNYTSILRGAPLILPYCPASFTAGCTSQQLVNQQTPVGTILALTYPYVNAGATQTSGFDIDMRAHYGLGKYGRVTVDATWTHLLTYQLTVGGVTYDLAGTHGPSGVSGDTGNPKDRASLQVSWQRGALTIAPSINFVGHFNITDPSSGIPTCGSALGYFGRFENGVTSQTSAFCSVGYYLQTDVYGAYQINSHFQIHAAVTNLFNKVPPVDVQTYGSGTNFYPYDAAFEQGGAVGRYFMIGATYSY